MRRHAKASSVESTDREIARSARRSGAASCRTIARARLALAPLSLGCAALIATTAILAGSAAPAVASETCPNEARRSEQGAAGLALSDCRAYEVVTPPQSEPERDSHIVPVSLNGDRVGFYSQFGPPPGSSGGSAGPYYLSSRGPAGWATQNEIPPQSTESGLFCNAYIAGYSTDLSQAVLADGWNWMNYPKYPDENGARDCGHDEPLLLPDEPQGAQNIFLHSTDAPNEAGFYQLLNLAPPDVAARDAYFQAGSEDFSHIAFTSPLQLTPEAPLPPGRIGGSYSVGENLYENVNGVLRLVTILPSGAPTWGILANTWESYSKRSSASFTHAVSNDGERILFYGAGELGGGSNYNYVGGNLYLRQNAGREQSAIASGQCSEPAKACTVQVDERNSDASGASGGGHFQWASADGSRVFFTDCTRLTADSTAVPSSPGGCGDFKETQSEYLPPSGNDLYEYDLEKPVGQRLVDLTVDHNGADALGANVQGLAGVSEDGSYVYFVATGVLTGAEQNSQGATAVAGQPNLYLWHAGTVTYVASLEPKPEVSLEEEDWTDWSSYTGTEAWNNATEGMTTSRVSRDGRFLAFNSQKSLTGYDNTVAATGEPANEVFLFDAATDELSCASCDPEGTPPTAEEHFEQARIDLPRAMGEMWTFPPPLLSGQLSDRGQVFFQTTDSLLPADVNGGDFDVYEYEAGHLHLVSPGTGDYQSHLRNASPDGTNVFFTTAEKLVGSDGDNATSLYDARVEGGFSEPPPTVVCESEEACGGQRQQPPSASTPGSAHFEGPGNVLRCPKSFARKRGGCVKVKRHRHGKRHHRRARLDRGGQK